MQIKFNLKIIICLSLYFCAQFVDAQEKNNNKKTRAKNQIIALSNGILLVKLYSEKNKLKALKDSDRLGEYEAKLKEEHDNIIASFKTHYKFSKVAFFYSHDHHLVKSGDYSSVIDMNGNVLNITTRKAQIFILDSRNVFVESMAIDQRGYSILGNDFQVLSKPFPYYVRKREALSFLRRDFNTLTLILNNNLEAYLNKGE